MGKKVDEMTEDKYLEGIVVVLTDCEFVLSEYMASIDIKNKISKDVLSVHTKILFKNGESLITCVPIKQVHEAIFKSVRPSETIIPLDDNPKNFSPEYLKGFLEGQRHERKQKIMFTPIQEVYNRWKDNEGHRDIHVWAQDMWKVIKEYCEVTK